MLLHLYAAVTTLWCFQIPAEGGTGAVPVFEASGPLVTQSSDTTQFTSQSTTEQVAAKTHLCRSILLTWTIQSCFHLYRQVPLEPASTTASVVDVPLPSPPLPSPLSALDSAAEVVPADPAPVLTQPLIEQMVNAAPTAAEVLQVGATEQSLAELGLAGYTPVGLIQNLLEFMHVDLGLPWWGAIVVGQQRWENTLLEDFSVSSANFSVYPSPHRNGAGPFGCVSSHCEGSEGSGQAQQCSAWDDKTDKQDERGQTERK